MYQMKHREDLEEVMDSFGAIIKGATYETYRVDRMTDVRMLGDPRVGLEAFRAINLKDYTKRTFSMLDGEESRVRIQFTQSLFNTVYERFGKDGVDYVKKDDHHFIFSARVKITDQFFGWLLGFGTNAKLLGEQEVVEQFVAYLDKIRKKY